MAIAFVRSRPPNAFHTFASCDRPPDRVGTRESAAQKHVQLSIRKKRALRPFHATV